MEALQSITSLPKPSVVTTALFAGLLGVYYLIWFRSAKRKECPAHLSSWIPYIGSALQLQKCLLRDFVTENAERLSAAMFTATIAGRKCLFLLDCEVVYKEMPQLDTRSLQKHFSKTVIRITDPKELELSFQDPKQVQSVVNLFHRHLIKSEPLQDLVQKTQQIMREIIPSLVQEAKGEVQLYSFIGKIVFCASMGPLISKHLMTDQAMQDFLKVEAAVPLLFSGAPSWLVQEALEAHKRLVQRMLQPDFMANASPLLIDRKTLLSYISDEMLAKNNLGLMVAAAANSMAAAFWTIFHIWQNPQALSACREEVSRFDSAQDGSWTMSQLDDMKVLQSCFMETLRLYQSVFIVRDVVDDLELKNPQAPLKTITVPKGTRIMGQPNVAHTNPQLFANPLEFQWDRFLSNQTPPRQFRPFGGGVHLCPGRKFVTYEVKALVAYLLQEYNVELLDTKTPSIDCTKQGLSVSRPTGDVAVKIVKKS